MDVSDGPALENDDAGGQSGSGKDFDNEDEVDSQCGSSIFGPEESDYPSSDAYNLTPYGDSDEDSEEEDSRGKSRSATVPAQTVSVSSRSANSSSASLSKLNSTTVSTSAVDKHRPAGSCADMNLLPSVHC